eukprot:m.23580 g.23580  ORF g.23580 m.23580 type:complete len:324 (-) comp12958_c0_seq2:292-1263(-)
MPEEGINTLIPGVISLLNSTITRTIFIAMQPWNTTPMAAERSPKMGRTKVSHNWKTRLAFAFLLTHVISRDRCEMVDGFARSSCMYLCLLVLLCCQDGMILDLSCSATILILVSSHVLLSNGFRDLRRDISRVHGKFTKSGNQEAESPMDEWLKFIAHENDAIAYAFAVIDTSKIDTFGKMMPSESCGGSTTGITFHTPTSEEAVEIMQASRRKHSTHPRSIQRREQRKRKAAEKRDTLRNSNDNRSTQDTAVLERLDRQVAVQSLKAVAEIGTSTQRRRAADALVKLALGQDWRKDVERMKGMASSFSDDSDSALTPPERID